MMRFGWIYSITLPQGLDITDRTGNETLEGIYGGCGVRLNKCTGLTGVIVLPAVPSYIQAPDIFIVYGDSAAQSSIM